MFLKYLRVLVSSGVNFVKKSGSFEIKVFTVSGFFVITAFSVFGETYIKRFYNDAL